MILQNTLLWDDWCPNLDIKEAGGINQVGPPEFHSSIRDMTTSGGHMRERPQENITPMILIGCFIFASLFTLMSSES